MFDYTNILNLHEFQIECSEGRYNIPIIKTEKFIPDKIIIYGKVPDELKSGNYEIISFSNTSMTWKYGHRGVSYKEKQ